MRSAQWVNRTTTSTNPDVFSYQVAQVGQQIECIMLLRVYEGSKTVLIFKHFDGEDPSNAESR
jgi:xylose isomerase